MIFTFIFIPRAQTKEEEENSSSEAKFVVVLSGVQNVFLQDSTKQKIKIYEEKHQGNKDGGGREKFKN